MTIDIPKNAFTDECYVIEIDGKVTSEYRIFAEALVAGMTFKQQFPQSDIKVRETKDKLSAH